MISNQILQNTIDGVKGITKIDLSVVDAEGNVLAETAGDSEDYRATVKTFADSPADSQAILGYQFFKVYDESQLEYIVVAKGEAEDVYMIGKIVFFTSSFIFFHEIAITVLILRSTFLSFIL